MRTVDAEGGCAGGLLHPCLLLATRHSSLTTASLSPFPALEARQKLAQPECPERSAGPGLGTDATQMFSAVGAPQFNRRRKSFAFLLPPDRWLGEKSTSARLGTTRMRHPNSNLSATRRSADSACENYNL
jgi:hypothetical protein